MTTATQPTQEQLDAAARDQEVKVQAIIRTLTIQRDSANNAVVNALADKAVVDAKLTHEIEMRNRFQQAHVIANQSNSELRILVANLQAQLAEKDQQLNDALDANVEHLLRIESLSTKAEPAQIDEEQIEVPSVIDETPPLPAPDSAPEECPDCSECPKDCSNKILLTPSPSKKN